MINKEAKNQNEEMKKILQYCIKFGETIGIDTPTAIERYIKVRKCEISQEKEKIREVRSKIKEIEATKILAEKALTNFWIKETEKRKIK